MRVWENLVGRGGGPMSFRLIVQPTVAIALAIRAGLTDARSGRPAFFWAVLASADHRRELVQHGWQDVSTVFVVAVVLDVIYQLIVHRGVYVLEVFITAALLAIIPYILVRGPVNRIARLFTRGPDADGTPGAAGRS